MLLAGTGAIVAMGIVFLFNLWLNPNTTREMRESVRLRQGDQPMGEAKLEKWLQEKRH